MSDYDRIAGIIEYLVTNAETRPGLAEVAARANLSPFHFQRMFRRWTGVSPKRFLQVITVERAKSLLASGGPSLLAASESLGLSSSSRLHDHFVRLEAVTPAEFRRRGRDLAIRYGEADSPFGTAFVATTARGVCAVSFPDHEPGAPPSERLRMRWPDAELVRDDQEVGRLARQLFQLDASRHEPLSLAVRGTNFQVAVWRALLAIPPGSLVAYGDLARAIGRPTAVRAVGTAVGANPCAFVIPCHRVIRESGAIGGYRWGVTRKRAMHVWEAAVTDGMLG